MKSRFILSNIQQDSPMKTVLAVLSALKKKGNPQRIQTFTNHGAPTDSLFGLSVADMKVIAKQIKGEQDLASELYDTGNSDAMYLAGIVADGKLMNKKQLDHWARNASWYMISEYTVPGVATESNYARELGLKWTSRKQELVASCGWNTLAGYITVTEDANLDIEEVNALLERVEQWIDSAANRVRYTMNGFVISVGSYVKPLSKQAKTVAKKIGKIGVDLGGTSCKVPLATEYIEKVQKSGRAFKKRKTIKC